MAPNIIRQLREYPCHSLQFRAANEIERLRERNAKLCKTLNRALSVIVEFGDMNGFRNLSNEELGRMTIAVAEECAALLNTEEGIPQLETQ